MKKEYQTPAAEKVEFDYSDTVVASTEAEANNEKGNAYFQCSCNTYYAPGYGQNCG